MKSTRFTRQRGAALVVGLVLLLILTLLAISGMNTATTELTMAGNEQYRANAFQAAETGIEQVIARGVFNTNAPVIDPQQTLASGTIDTTTLPRGITGNPSRYGFGNALVLGSSSGTFTAAHFQVDSTGTAQRNARADHTQGLWILVPN